MNDTNTLAVADSIENSHFKILSDFTKKSFFFLSIESLVFDDLYTKLCKIFGEYEKKTVKKL